MTVSATVIPTIMAFTSDDATLANAGGKGANLARLTQAGFPVPPGFIIATGAYRAFVQANRLGETINSCVSGLASNDSAQLENASSQIRAAFSAGQLDLETQASIRVAYEELQARPVAVRSSATTEDLPELSFAGQQDTFLNVTGEQALYKAVVDCWSSLWTARAIGYRIRNNIAHADALVAVVVQAMVASEVSGVLFTANPLTGRLSESVLDATFGLGEALVSGQVEPDSFVVNTRRGEVIQKTLGAKQVATRASVGGGTETVQENSAEQQTLTDEQILLVAVLGEQIQAAFGAPQDIEWALDGGQIFVLQARPITSLFPVPEVSFDPLVVWFSFGAVQGLVGPITPIGQDTIRCVAAGAGTMFGVQPKPEEQKLFELAGQRIWIRISDVIRNPVGSKIFGPALGFVEPSVGQILATLAEEPQLGMATGRLKLGSVGRILRFGLPVMARLVHHFVFPDKARAEIEALIEAKLAIAQIAPAGDRFGRLANIVGFIRDQVANALSFLLPHFIAIFGPSMASLNMLKKIAGDHQELALEVTRSLPGNVTTAMDLALWKAAAAIGEVPEARSVFEDGEAGVLARRYLEHDLPPAAQAAIDGFMDRYGMRGVGEIDFGQPRWREDPTAIMYTLQSYLTIDPEKSPEAQFARGEQAAAAAIEQLAAEARRQHFGWLKEKQARMAARRIRLLMGARESPKFFAVRTIGVAREALLEAGRDFVAAGTILLPEDLSFLMLKELEALSRNESGDWQALIAERRAAFQRELRRRQVPRVLVSDGRAFYEGIDAQAAGSDTLSGSPVSPGVVEGLVRVVLDPGQTRLNSGEILVCPGTDPAWTPLFMQAGGLITEVGGMMTHGSVVAREYGIPAVVGVHEATSRLKDGDRIRLDGTSGKIVILGD